MNRKTKTPAIDFATLPEGALLRQRQLLSGVVPFSAATLWRRVRAQEFPQPIRLSDGRVTAWRWSDVRDWLKAQGGEA